MITDAPSPNRCEMAFAGLAIGYDRRVLEPRPWTVAQSEWAAELSDRLPPGPILELCCGAGHIGLAVAAATGRALHQVDADPVACSYARSNAAAAGLALEVSVWQADVDDDAAVPAGPFPIILADPPYLTPEEVKRYPDDPSFAIDGGPDGLATVRRCLDAVASRLELGGIALIQLRGPEQVLQLVTELGVRTRPLSAVEARHMGNERSILAVRRCD